MPDIDAGYVLKQHDFAKKQYSEAIDFSEEVLQLFKAEYDIPRDIADTLTPSGPRITKPAKARAYLEKYLTLLNVRATSKIQVVPRKTGEQELKECSKIERWLTGYQRAYQREVKKPLWRHGTMWFLLRGRMCLECRFDPSYLNTEQLPVRTYADDPNCIFSVWGRDGIGYYTKEYSRYVWDVRGEIERRRKSGKKSKWHSVKLPDDDNEMVDVVEYWNDEHGAIVVGDDLAWLGRHDYGFVPLAEAHCMDTPLADMRWAYQSVLGPILDSLKQQYILASKLATGVDLFYWPKILVQTVEGRAVMLDSGAPGVEAHIPADAKVTVLSPTPNAQVLQMLMGWLSGDVQLGGIPDIAWGAEPTNLQSGFAVAQVLNQIMDKIHDKKINLELALGWHFGHVLRVVEKYGKLKGVKLSVVSTEVVEYGKEFYPN